MTIDAGSRLESFGAGIASDGEVTFTFHRANKTQASISVPFNNLADLLLGLEAKAAEALAMLNAASRGGDRRLMMPIKKRSVTKLQGAGAQGMMVLSLELDKRLALDMALSPDQVKDTIDLLQAFQNRAGMAQPKPN